MATNLVKNINNRKRFTVYYDPSFFNEDITLSIHLVRNKSNPIKKLEYNTIYDETYSTSGLAHLYLGIDETDSPIYGEELTEIGIHLNAIPPITQILGNTTVKFGNSYTYTIPSNYDLNNLYTYEWSVDNGSIVGDNTTKIVSILYPNTALAKIYLKIARIDEPNCFITISLSVLATILQNKFLIATNLI